MLCQKSFKGNNNLSPHSTKSSDGMDQDTIKVFKLLSKLSLLQRHDELRNVLKYIGYNYGFQEDIEIELKHLNGPDQ